LGSVDRGDAIQKLADDELFGFASDTWRVLGHECLITLELELVSTCELEHAGVTIATLTCIGLILLHLQEVANSGDLLANEMIDRVVRVIS